MATRIMRDSTTAADIPLKGTELVAGYANGRYAWSRADWERFAGIPRASIDVFGDDYGADILDVENGDATIAKAVEWTTIKWRGPIIYPPVIYIARSNLTPLFNAMDAAGHKIVQHFRLGIATLDGTETVEDMTGVTFVQARGTDLTGGHWDESTVYDPAWMPGVAPAPPKPPAPAPIEGVLVELPSGTSERLVSGDGGATWHREG